jgi:hypothetical protein
MNKIIKIISKFLFAQKVKKLQATQEREKRFMSYPDIRTILILFESEFTEKNPIIRSLVRQLAADGKKVTTCGFINKKDTKSAILPDSRIIDLSQVSFWGEPKNIVVGDLYGDEYDMVLDLTLSDILPLRYVLAYVNSPFKVGRKNMEFNLLDFMIDINASFVEDEEDLNAPVIDENYLFSQVIFYLKNIKSNN